MVEKKALQKRHSVIQSYSQKITFNSIGYFTEKKSQQQDRLCSLLREHDCSQCNVIFFFFVGFSFYCASRTYLQVSHYQV